MTLALYGGEPLRTEPFPPWPQHDDCEGAALQRVLGQGSWWRVGGQEVDRFEQEFAAFQRAPSALAVTTGTHALELALELSGVGPGHEVIVPAFTFISTSIAVQRRGARPVPADVDPDTYCLDPAAAATAVTDATRAVIPVHMAGHRGDVDALSRAVGPAVTVIEDAAHAHGAERNGVRSGEDGHLACFSFQNGKLMTAGEGGLVTLPSAELHEEAFVRHSCGRPPSDRHYEHRTPSSNYRMDDFRGGLLRCQLGRLPDQLRRREERGAVLDDLLAKVLGAVPQGRDADVNLHSRYMAMLTLDQEKLGGIDRDLVVDALNAEGVPAFVNYPPVYRTASFWPDGEDPEALAELARRCPRAERISSHGLWLHHRVLLGDEADMQDVATAVARVLGALSDR